MIVYRVALPPEHVGNSSGSWSGPYRDGWNSSDEKVKAVSNRLCREHVDETHPTPWTDIFGGIEENEYCVLTSPDQVARWFENFGYDLDDAGYRVVVYDTSSNVREGEYQAVAAVTDDEIIETWEPLGMIP